MTDAIISELADYSKETSDLNMFKIDCRLVGWNTLMKIIKSD